MTDETLKKLVFLVSGNGGNLNFVISFLKQNEQKGKYFFIDSVIADRDCNALEIAKKNNIKSYLIHYERDCRKDLEDLLQERNPDIVVTNIHKIIDSDIVRKYKSRLINIHYSLLPAFKGMIGSKPVSEAIKLGCKVVGSTVHYVDDEVDNGKIISQCVIPVSDNIPFQKLMEMVFRTGCLILLNSLFIVSHINLSSREYSSLLFNNQQVIFSPPLSFDTLVFDENFWQEVKSPLVGILAK